MSLRGVHILFIVLSTLLALGFGLYCFREWRADAGAGFLAGGVVSVLAAVALLAYGRWFLHKMRRVPAVLAAVWLATDAARACTTCYGEAQGPMIDGARMGVILLLGVVFVVQGGFVWFFLHLRRRARLADREPLQAEWLDLQKGHLP